MFHDIFTVDKTVSLILGWMLKVNGGNLCMRRGADCSISRAAFSRKVSDRRGQPGSLQHSSSSSVTGFDHSGLS